MGSGLMKFKTGRTNSKRHVSSAYHTLLNPALAPDFGIRQPSQSPQVVVIGIVDANDLSTFSLPRASQMKKV